MSILVTFWGIETFSIAVFENTSLSITANLQLCGKSTDFKLLQSEKAYSPIIVTFGGIENFTIEEEANASRSIIAKFEFLVNSTDFKFSQQAKEYSPIFVTDEGMLTSLMEV